jgi:hypothetical protein
VPDRSAEDLQRDPQAKDEPDSLVPAARKTNDPKALKKQALDDKAKALAEEVDLRSVLATMAGVRFVARIMGICGVDEPYFHPSNSWMCEIAGRRSIGGQIKNWIRDCDFELWPLVDREIEKLRAKPKKD